MLKQIYTAFAVTLILAPLAVAPSLFAKPKDPSLPIFILHARTVAVIIDPSAGVSLDNPRANEVARKDVQAALLAWGRFEIVQAGQAADLTIIIRKRSGKLADATVSDPRQNSRPGDVTATEDAIMIGGQHGRPPNPSGNPAPEASGSPHPQGEAGSSGDSFIVCDGTTDTGMGGNIGWRYVAKDALHSHDVPAVDAFRKAIAEAEKAAAAKQQGKTPPASQPGQTQPPAAQPHP